MKKLLTILLLLFTMNLNAEVFTFKAAGGITLPKEPAVNFTLTADYNFDIITIEDTPSWILYNDNGWVTQKVLNDFNIIFNSLDWKIKPLLSSQQMFIRSEHINVVNRQYYFKYIDLGIGFLFSYKILNTSIISVYDFIGVDFGFRTSFELELSKTINNCLFISYEPSYMIKSGYDHSFFIGAKLFLKY